MKSIARARCVAFKNAIGGNFALRRIQARAMGRCLRCLINPAVKWHRCVSCLEVHSLRPDRHKKNSRDKIARKSSKTKGKTHAAVQG